MRYRLSSLIPPMIDILSETVQQPLGIGSAALGASTDALIMLVMSFYLLKSGGGSRR